MERYVRVALAVVCVFALASCGGGSGAGGTTKAAAPPSDQGLPPGSGAPSSDGNRAPTIKGTPPAAVGQDEQYLFEPIAQDADGDPLTFSVSNLPPWAEFDTDTGRLKGVPGEADIGTYSNILIQVSDGKSHTTLSAFDISVLAMGAASITLAWEPPTENTDNTPITDLAGYKIYWGTSPGLYLKSVTIDNPGVTTYVVEHLVPGTYYFTATALNSLGAESEFCNEIEEIVN